MIKTEVIGKPIDRKDGRAKVTGAAKYAAEFGVNNLAYAFPIRSTIGSGTITAFDTGAAEKAGGVIKIFTPDNAPRLKTIEMMKLFAAGSFLGEMILPLQDKKVNYFGQYIGLVVAETYEQARTAAEMVNVTYSKQTPAIDLKTEMSKADTPKTSMFGAPVQINAGKTAAIIKSAPVKIEQTYTTRTENHHPMEPHATIAAWDGDDKILIYDATQGVKGVQGMAAYFYDLKPENVQITSPFVGGGFGCKGSQWSHILLTIMAAKAIKRPVKLVLTRQMMVTNVGRRPETMQKVALAADKDGNLKAIRHENTSYKSFSGYFEESGTQTKTLYKSDEREITYKIADFNINPPTFMRAPGETPGTFALESAMDELANELKIDPIKLRTINHSAVDPESKLPFSLENLVECYTVGAEKFGWSNRKSHSRE